MDSNNTQLLKMKKITVLKNKFEEFLVPLRSETDYNAEYWEIVDLVVGSDFNPELEDINTYINSNFPVDKWEDEKFNVRVTIPSDVVLMNDVYLQLKGWVLYLESIGRALYIMANGVVVMYFVELLPEHKAILEQDASVLIENKTF